MNQPEKRHPLTYIFFDTKSMFRSGWRFFIFATLFVLVMVLLGGGLNVVLNTLPIGFSDDSLLGTLFPPAVGLTAALLVGWFCLQGLEGLPFKALGASFTKGWGLHFLYGGVIGAITLCLAAGFAAVFGGLRFEFNSDAGSSAILLTLIISFVIFFVGAAFEEAVMRGYVLQTFVRSNLAVFGVILTSLLFASGHLGNNNTSTLPVINTALAGVWLAIAYLKTRTLWFAFGLHLMWNWVQASFFGIEVSGFTKFATAPLLLEVDRGPVWISGGDYGIEGGIACTVALIVSTILIWYSPVLKADEEMIAMTSPGYLEKLNNSEA